LPSFAVACCSPSWQRPRAYTARFGSLPSEVGQCLVAASDTLLPVERVTGSCDSDEIENLVRSIPGPTEDLLSFTHCDCHPNQPTNPNKNARRCSLLSHKFAGHTCALEVGARLLRTDPELRRDKRRGEMGKIHASFRRKRVETKKSQVSGVLTKYGSANNIANQFSR
jgi:hypothetical protein